MKSIGGTRTVITQGQYVGETGAGYDFAPCEAPGGISQETRGYYQGYREPVTLLVPEDCEVYESKDGSRYLQLPSGKYRWDGYPIETPMTACEAIMAGIVMVAE